MERKYIYGLLLLGALLVCPAGTASQQYTSNFEKTAAAFLPRYVRNGLVNYKTIGRKNAALNQLVWQIETFDIKNCTASEKKAFYINAYNLLVIHSIRKSYPVKSVKQVPGFFNEKKYKVAGEMLTLDGIQKEKLMKQFKDPRVHFALVCGAIGCPPLQQKPWLPQDLDQQLDRLTRKLLNDPKYVQVLHAEKKVLLPQIFKWYQEDFTEGAATLVDYLNRYLSVSVPATYAIAYYEYDWALNEFKSDY